MAHHHANASTLPKTLGTKTVYYQCKTCLSFLSSSSKWAGHLQKCRSTLNGNDGLSPKPIAGLRLVTFMEPKLILERLSDTPDHKFAVPAVRGSKRPKRNRKNRVNRIQPVVRSFNFRCHLCPGGFDSKFQFDRHVNGVHTGVRRLMPCCVCDKVFNKRDSLNEHLLAHERAEARDEQFGLFLKPWTANPALSKDIRLSLRLVHCKFCLLLHSSHHSYVTHIREEHSDPPEAFQFPCKFDNCVEKFSSIRALLEHAKISHPQSYYGKLAWMRMKTGIFTRKLVVPKDKDGTLLWQQRVLHNVHKKKSSKVPSLAVGKAKKKPQISKRVKSFIPFQKLKKKYETSCHNNEVPSSDKAQRHIVNVPSNSENMQDRISVKNIKLESIEIDGETYDQAMPVIKIESLK